ncbi:MAG: metallophosphoesterase, partial [Vicinamibacterales bacterium]
MRHLRPWIVLATALLVAPPLGARGEGGRVVAIGDVHGSLDGFRAVLRAARLIDGDSHWTGGDATLVQTGDVTDRGADVRGVLDLLMALMREAPGHGGRVLPVLGNHEAMNLVGELRDVTPAICASFAGRDGEAVRDRGWQAYQRLARARSRTRRGERPPGLMRT